jgi:hypothetical protein
LILAQVPVVRPSPVHFKPSASRINALSTTMSNPATQYEYSSDDDEEDQQTTSQTTPHASTIPSRNALLPTRRSPYHLPASEQLRGVANRIIFSRYYILFYFIMMSLSMTTVVISLIATRTSPFSLSFNPIETSRRSKEMSSCSLAYPGGDIEWAHGPRSRNKMGSIWKGLLCQKSLAD